MDAILTLSEEDIKQIETDAAVMLAEKFKEYLIDVSINGFREGLSNNVDASENFVVDNRGLLKWVCDRRPYYIDEFKALMDNQQESTMYI